MKTKNTHFTIGQVARLSHLTVRALRFFDELELLRPSRRTEAGYRLYTEADVRRLHQILVMRELGLPLENIKTVLSSGETSLREALEHQRASLSELVRRTTGVLRAIDHALDALKGDTMAMETLFEGTEDFNHPYEDEARERWGNTDAYKESARRTRQYGKAQWAAIKAESDAIYRGLAALFKEGRPPDCLEARNFAEQHREHITRWFYPCSHECQVGISQMYTDDPRFTATLEGYGEGVAAYTTAAIAANAAQRALEAGQR